MSVGLFAIGLIILLLGASVASVDKISSLPTAFLVVGAVLMFASVAIRRGGKR